MNRLQRRETERVAAHLAKSTSLTYRPSGRGEYVSGTGIRQLQLVFGRFAMLEDGSRLPAHALAAGLRQADRPPCEGLTRSDGGIECDRGRQRGWGCEGASHGVILARRLRDMASQRGCSSGEAAHIKVSNPAAARADEGWSRNVRRSHPRRSRSR
ncbi:DUF3363 domain-containing protein [Ancylobacter tetraedralis]|uniref:DUF3363 domain-containing protein n=1 Tax=Ancylobacter tetraedralis TaxID=217068 RepID=UPI003CCD071B